MTLTKAALICGVLIAVISGTLPAFAIVPTYTATQIGPPASDYVYGQAINSAGDITGQADFHAFVQSGSTFRDLGTFGGPASSGNSINSHGQVAGYAQIRGGAA